MSSNSTFKFSTFGIILFHASLNSQGPVTSEFVFRFILGVRNWLNVFFVATGYLHVLQERNKESKEEEEASPLCK